MGIGKSIDTSLENEKIILENEELKNTVDRNLRVFETVNSWINNADNKVSVSCGVFTGAYGIISFLAESYLKSSSSCSNKCLNDCMEVIVHILFALGLIFLAVSLFFFARAIIPNLTSDIKRTEATQKRYPIFYGDIALLNRTEFSTLMQKTSLKDYNEELLIEIHINSQICSKKMKLYKHGVICSLIAVFCALITLAIRYIIATL